MLNMTIVATKNMHYAMSELEVGHWDQNLVIEQTKDGLWKHEFRVDDGEETFAICMIEQALRVHDAVVTEANGTLTCSNTGRTKFPVELVNEDDNYVLKIRLNAVDF